MIRVSRIPTSAVKAFGGWCRRLRFDPLGLRQAEHMISNAVRRSPNIEGEERLRRELVALGVDAGVIRTLCSDTMQLVAKAGQSSDLNQALRDRGLKTIGARIKVGLVLGGIRNARTASLNAVGRPAPANGKTIKEYGKILRGEVVALMTDLTQPDQVSQWCVHMSECRVQVGHRSRCSNSKQVCGCGCGCRFWCGCRYR